ncbi:MAG: amidohydrolase family protein [Solobacterium sp.]|nr:amidohydrolase family protein [Solobacterium sp.]
MAKVLLNGHLYQAEGTALYMDEGVIIHTGTDEEIQQYIQPDDEVTDLNRAYVYPGFSVPHISLIQCVSLTDHEALNSLQDIRVLLERASASRDLWVRGEGLDRNLVSSETKTLLDGFSRPVLLYGNDHTWCMVNAAALKKADIDQDTTIPDGTINMETGLLEGQAVRVLESFLPAVSPEEIREKILAAVHALNRNGFTGAGSHDFIQGYDWKTVLDGFMRLSYQGALTLRVDEQCMFEIPEELAHFLDEGYTTDVGDDFFRIGPLYIDQKEEDSDVMMELANSYNMPALLDTDLLMKELKDLVLEGNPLGYAVNADRCGHTAKHQAVTKQIRMIGSLEEDIDDLTSLLCDPAAHSIAKIIADYAAKGIRPGRVIELLSKGSELFMRREYELGQIREGFLADLCVTDHDLETDYEQAKVIMTLIGGEQV